jgi:hypothetical protein
MKKITEITEMHVLAAFFAFMVAFIIGSCTNSCADYASAQEDRIKQQQNESRYWNNREKVQDMYDSVERENIYKYRNEKREIDIERRQKKLESGDYSTDNEHNHKRGRK